MASKEVVIKHASSAEIARMYHKSRQGYWTGFVHGALTGACLIGTLLVLLLLYG